MVKFVFPFTKRKIGENTYIEEPKIPVTYLGGGESVELNAIIDSGSTTSFLPYEIAASLGFSKEKSESATAKGIGGEEETGKFEIDLKITRKNQRAFIRKMPVLVFLNPKQKFCILGLSPLFEKFDITFRMKDGKIEMKER